ncbi:MAG: hypothetical protein PQJ46_04490, partial [Spirochaetales bacterium]|nr:hypothetical protein [Spirochaetales bacterium]
MKKRQKFWIFLLFTILTISLASCSLINSDFDYFSDYSDVNLINSQPLSDWSTTRDTENYMGYEEVDTSITSTDGLSDENLTIYRLENKNLVPSGDFEGISTLAAAGWVESGGDNSIISSGHNLDNNALRFDLVRGYYISYDLNQLSDGAVVNST